MILQTLAFTTILLSASTDHKFGLTEAMPRIDGTIRIGSYNMLNFFDQKDDPTLQGDYDDFGDNPGPTSLDRCKELATIIRELDADVLSLQEVESQEALGWFNDEYLKDMGYKYVISEEVGYYRGIEQSILSRFPVTDVKTWRNADLTKIERIGGGWTEIPAGEDSITFQRSPLCVTIQTPEGYKLTILGVHHKAGKNAWHRELEALQIAKYIKSMTEEDPERNIAVIGDFNAQPWDRSVRVYLRNGMTDALSHRAVHLKWDDNSPLRKTHTSGRVIDFIMLNAPAVGELVVDSGFVLGSDHPEYDWRNDPIPTGYSSDHCALAVDLVPIEGKGSTLHGAPWPDSLTKTALRNSPPEKAIVQSKPKTDSESIPPDGAPFLASKRSKVFHKADCGNAKRISEKNQVGFPSFEDAEGAGKRPAKCCKPTAN
ncbi:MAG: endonuclease/exonuclease/phosphatase family protein [Phycisphaerales bacterium]|nr:endonuclease/exonuclease/phosphatase family protein [Planctomycetota bacterium]MBL6997922.1 endonuclease/exonuclease/phosphatase family protein [Phycisphaerales bacterium]